MAAILVFISLKVVSPLLKSEILQKSVSEEQDTLKAFPLDHPELFYLQKEIAWTESLILLSKEDSIQLAVNLKDSLLILYLKGVPIHQVRISEFRSNPVLAGLPGRVYLRTFSRPLDVTGVWSTIVKEPIVIREAPSDPLEAEMTAWEPDTLVQNPAFFLLSMEHGIELAIGQDQNLNFRDRWVSFKFYSRWEFRRFFRLFSYSPSIRILIPVDDVRAIYRALPGKVKVSVTF